RAPLALLAPGLARALLGRDAVADPLADLLRRLGVHHEVVLVARDGLVGPPGIVGTPEPARPVTAEAPGALGQPAAALGGRQVRAEHDRRRKRGAGDQAQHDGGDGPHGGWARSAPRIT